MRCFQFIFIISSYMWSEKYKPSHTKYSSYNQNFQLLRLRNLDTNLNPQQIASLSHKSNQSTPRYDKSIKSPPKSFRIHKQKHHHDARSQSGRTVYQIYNLKGKTQQIQSNKSSSNQPSSSEIFSHFGQRGLLPLQKKIHEPSLPTSNITECSHSNSPIKYQQRKWDMNEPTKNLQCKVGSIRSQEFHRQGTLTPGKAEQCSSINFIPESKLKFQQIPQQSQDKELQQNLETPVKSRYNNKMKIEKQLIQKLNTRTRYLRFRHNEKIKKTIKSNQSILISKEPSSLKIDKFIIQYGDSIQTLIRILHHNSNNNELGSNHSLHSNKNKLKITVQIPQFFHHCPDPFLVEEQMQFRGISYFEEVGIIPPQLADQCELKIIKHPESFMYQYEQIKSQNDPTILKYCINWYSDDSVYLGQIVDDLRDGIGMQWVPGMYVYYGQYKDNFRHGYGIMKYNSMKAYIGTWSFDHYQGYGKIISPQGQVLEAGTYRNSQLKSSELFNELS